MGCNLLDLDLRWAPLATTLVMGCGVLVVLVIAVLRGDVSPYLPYISEAGGLPPESGIFSLILYFGGTAGMITMLLRYLAVDVMNRDSSRVINLLNKISCGLGIISVCGMLVVAAYPVTILQPAHMTGAYMLFIVGVVYCILQTVLSYVMYPDINGIAICRVRLTIALVNAMALIGMIVMGPIGHLRWKEGQPSHKAPGDEGFYELLASSACEWLMAGSFISFFLTFVREFSKVRLKFEVLPLVHNFETFNDEI